VDPLGIPYQLTDVDGVPCFWADAPGPCMAGLLFRVGRADEQLAGGGITHLIQHLALLELGHQRYDYNGQVDATTTSFYATGEPSDVVSFLAHVCRALREPPLDRVSAERRVLGIESERREPGLGERLLMMRFGAAGHGLPFYEELGLRRLGSEQLQDWSRSWFTRANAVLWITCPPPPELWLALPDGQRMPAPEPQAIGALELPAFAAAGSGGVASTLVVRRSPAIAVAARTVADRAHALLAVERGLADDVAAWQFPLTGDLSHRSLTLRCEDDVAPEVVEAIAGIYASVAADGPAREELALAYEDAMRAIADPEAVPGGLDYMAVNELLGAPRMWKEELAREAEAVSYAEVAAALREALTTQLVLAPAGTPGPAGALELRDFPWFSTERVQGMELRPDRTRRRRGDPAVRLVVSQDGVSHVSDDTGQASTVHFAELAAALQEPDGSLVLIARDGAIVPLDPNVFRGAGEVIGDLEQRLPPELVVPPRDALSWLGAGVEQVARRKLRRRWVVEKELRLLPDRLDHEEDVITLCEAVVGFKPGLLTLTDRRVIWLHQGPRELVVRELPYGHVTDVKLSRFPSHVVTLRSPAGETAFSEIHPKERGQEIVQETRRRVAAAQARTQQAPQ
jgi:hypothetical protein